MENMDLDELWTCLDTSSEASQESRNVDSATEEERLKKAEEPENLASNVCDSKPTEKSDNGQSDQKVTKDAESVEENSLDSVKLSVSNDITDPKPSSSGSDSSKRPFQLNDNMKKGLSMLAYPSKGARSHSKPRSKGLQQPRTKVKSRITIGETIEKVQDIKNSLAEQEASSNSTSMTEMAAVPLDTTGIESGGPSVSSNSAENSDASAQSANTEPKAKVREKENWTGKGIDQPKHVGVVSPTNKGGKPEERIPLATKPRAPPTRFKLTTRMGELLRFTFAHEHFPTSVHMARLAKMMGVQWSQVRNWFTNRRVENKRAGIFPRDKVLTECPFCDVTLKTEAEQKGHLFATHHVKNILGAEFVGDMEPIKWKKFPTSINAVNKLSGTRVLAIGYTADSESDSQATLAESLESSTHSPDTLLQTLSNDSGKMNSRSLHKTWQVSMGIQSTVQTSPKGSTPHAKGSAEELPPHSSTIPGQKRNENVVYLKMETGEEKAITTKENTPVPGSLRVKPDELLLSSSVSFAPLVNVPSVHPGDPCTSKSNLIHEAEPQLPKIVKVETSVETMEVDQPESNLNMSMDNQERSNKDVQADKNPKLLLFKPPDKQFPSKTSFHKNLQETDKKQITSDIQKKNFTQKNKANEIVPSRNIVINSNNSLNVPPVKENLLMKGPEDGQSKTTTTFGLPSVNPTISGISNFIEPKDCMQNFPRTPHSKVESVRHKFQDRMSDEFLNIGYQCPTCSKVFISEWQMMKHSLTHFKFQCDICEHSFSSEVDLKQHLYEHLTNTYEEEKYYVKLSCRTCHSLKCDCFEPSYFKAEEMLRSYAHPQKARRSSKVFLSKPNSGPNDHLRVTLGSYRKRLQKMHPSTMLRGATSQVNQDNQRVLLRNLNHPLQKNKLGHQSIENSQVSCSRLQGSIHNTDDNKKLHETINLNQRDIPRLTVRNDLLMRPSEELSGAHSPTPASEEKAISEKRGRGKRTTKLSSNFIYKDTDFYFMCEMCDASFLSKAELSEHMFFHRLKSRSRRAGKRRLAEAEQEEENEVKKFKEEEPLTSEDVVTINVGGFERFKCPNCKGHFASITDLNRHRTQAHKGNETVTPASECLAVPCIMFQCYFCNRFYRRERELRRHLKHDCLSAPEDLKSKLSVGVSLTSLQEMGGGPYFIKIERNTVDNVPSEFNSKMSLNRGPITCKYCFMVTRREAEMKRHVWKYCPKIPKSVIKMFKEGASLEELGFVYGEVTVEPVSPLTSSNQNVLNTPENDIDETSEHSSPSTVSVSPTQTPAVPVINPMPLASSSRSKGPLICTYCGIWYFREISLLKHMKERCIKISQEDKQLLENGSGLCTFTPEAPLETCGPAEKQGIYKIVDRSRLPLTPVRAETTEPLSVGPSSSQGEVSIQAIKLEPEESNTQTETTPTKQTEIQEEITSPESSPVKSSARKTTRCRRCHETFSSQDAIIAHSSVHHGPKKGFYKCKLCQLKLVKYKHLREHVWEHTNETPYKCHLCGVKFRTSDSIMDHLYSIHNFTLINDKNLYKWLPGRSGKYREIKGSNRSTDCEGTLADMDTNLDNLAEVMVVTDKDIWEQKGDKKSPKKKLQDEGCKTDNVSPNTKTSTAGQKGTKCDIEATPLSKCSPLENIKVEPEIQEEVHSDILKQTKTPEKVNKNVQDKKCVDHKNIVLKSKQTANLSIPIRVKTVRRSINKESSSAAAENKGVSSLSSHSNFVEVSNPKSGNVPSNIKKRKLPENADSDTSTNIQEQKKGSGLHDESTEDSGEEFLSCLENLESVIETVQLTDNCLS